MKKRAAARRGALARSRNGAATRSRSATAARSTTGSRAATGKRAARGASAAGAPVTAAAPLAVAVVAFDRISPFHLSVPCIVFDEERAGPLAARYRLRVCAAAPGKLRTTAGFSLEVERGLRALATADVVIVPSWRDVDERPPEPLLAALRKAHARGATLIGLCLGAFVLAEAGLLDGRAATTHWYCAGELARRYPAVTVRADVLYIDEGSILTSAGSAAGIDCCLHLIRRQHGAELANQVARRLVVPPHRQGGQAQFIEQPLPKAEGEARLTSLLDWARGNLRRALDVDVLARRAAMSRRTFTRHFRKHTGTSVTQWVLAQRLAYAQRVLETSDQPIDRVAEAAGFGSAVSLRQHFAAAFATTPTAWRRQFRGA